MIFVILHHGYVYKFKFDDFWSHSHAISSSFQPARSQGLKTQFQKTPTISKVQKTPNVSKIFTCFFTTDMFLVQILMIPAKICTKFSPLSDPKAKNALKHYYLTKNAKCYFSTFQNFENSKLFKILKISQISILHIFACCGPHILTQFNAVSCLFIDGSCSSPNCFCHYLFME